MKFLKPTVEQVQKSFREGDGDLIQMSGYVEKSIWGSRPNGENISIEDASAILGCVESDILEYPVTEEDDYHLAGETFFITLKKI